MPSTVYKGDLAEVTFGHETGIVLSRGAWGALTWTHTTTGDVSKITFTGGTERTVSSRVCSMFDASSRLKYPKGMLAGSSLRIKGGGNFSADDHTTGALFTIIHNQGDYIEVTPSLKTAAGTNAAAGDELLIGSLGTPSMDVGMSYDDSAELSDETVLTDQFIGLAASVTLPETSVNVLRSHVVGLGRNVMVQEAQSMRNDGGAIETMMHSARWFYYALGNEAVAVPGTVASTVDTANAKAIAMGDTYVEFDNAINTGLDAIIPGDYIVVKDSTETLHPYTTERGSNRVKWTGAEDLTSATIQSSERNETRRVLAVDNTAGFRRIYIDDPFNFDHSAGADVVLLKADDADTNGSPHFDTDAATYGSIKKRQKRVLWSKWRQPSFSLESSMRLYDVDSYGKGGYNGSQSSNVPGGATDAKQLTRVYKGCKVKSWELTADVDAQVKMKVDFDAMMCYTDTGRLENDNGVVATATIVVTDSGGIQNGHTFTLTDSFGLSTVYTANSGMASGAGGGSSGSANVGLSGVGGGSAGKVAAAAAIAAAINGTTDADYTAASNGVDTVTVTQKSSGATGNTTSADAMDGVTVNNFTSGAGSEKGDRFTAHRMFDNIGDSKTARKVAGIAPNTEKPFFYYNGTITGFGTTIAQVTSFKLSGQTETTPILTVGANPLQESRNSLGQSLQQIPYAGSRNPSLNVEGKIEYELEMEIIPSDPLLWHEFRTNRTHEYDEPITLHLQKDGAGTGREEVFVIIDDYVISEAPLQIPEDFKQIKMPMKILPKHVKVVGYDTLFHA